MMKTLERAVESEMAELPSAVGLEGAAATGLRTCLVIRHLHRVAVDRYRQFDEVETDRSKAGSALRQL